MKKINSSTTRTNAPTDEALRSLGDSVIGIAIENATIDLCDREGRALGSDPETGYDDEVQEARDWAEVLSAAASDLDSRFPEDYEARDVLRAMDIGAASEDVTGRVRKALLRLI